MNELKQKLREVEKLDTKRERFEERRGAIQSRIAELEQERDAAAAKKISIYDPPKNDGDRVEHLLAGERPLPEKKVVDKRVLQNTALDHEVALFTNDINLLQEELEKSTQEISETASERNQAYESFLFALRDFYCERYYEHARAFVHNALIPILALSKEFSSNSLRGPGGLLGRIVDGIEIGWWEQNRKVNIWPIHNDTTEDGLEINYEEIVAELIEDVEKG